MSLPSYADSNHDRTVARDRARQLRRPLTPAEAMLWRRLRAGSIAGLKFRRQHPMAPYIVDFCCVARRLVVELDGPSHDDRQEYDAERTTYLGTLGYRVIRFANQDVLHHCEGVLAAIAEACGVRFGDQ